MHSTPSSEATSYSNLPVYELKERTPGFSGGIALEWGEIEPKLLSCRDGGEYLAIDATLPDYVVINASEQFKHLCATSKLTEHFGGILYKTVFDAVLGAMSQSLDMVGNVYATIEQAVDNYISIGVENSFLDLPDGDLDAESLLITELCDDLVGFALRVYSTLVNSPVPVFKTIGCPYEMFGYTPAGNVLLVKMEPSRVIELMDF